MTINAIQLLQLWEHGQGQSPIRQALMLLKAINPGLDQQVLATYSIGRRDKNLISLREKLFGEQLQCVTHCPSCNEKLEFHCDVKDLKDDSQIDEGQQQYIFSDDEYRITYRAPNTSDLLITEQDISPTLLLDKIFNNCIVEIQKNGKLIPVEQLPKRYQESLQQAMEKADPQADVTLDLQCPNCQTQWQSTFDIVSYLWTEVDAWAKQTLSHVHSLAATYGWSENKILEMSAWRRQYYLGMIYQ